MKYLKSLSIGFFIDVVNKLLDCDKRCMIVNCDAFVEASTIRTIGIEMKEIADSTLAKQWEDEREILKLILKEQALKGFKSAIVDGRYSKYPDQFFTNENLYFHRNELIVSFHL